MSKEMSICDRVYMVGGAGFSAPEDCCIYLVDAGSDLVLIDAGVGNSLARIEKNILSLNLEPTCISYIIATHCHIDHVGGLAGLVKRYGSKIVAHELDRNGIEGNNSDLTAASIYGVDYSPVNVDMLLKGDLVLLTFGDMAFNIMHTPGHTPGSISIYLDTSDGRVLFGQDIHGPFLPIWGSDLVQWRRSMEKLLALKADILCEGHAGVIRGEMIERYIEGYLIKYF